MIESTPSDLFPARLEQARRRRKLSQAALAARSGLQSSAISHFETGTRKPSFDNLKKLADALNVTTDYLLGRVNEFDEVAGAARLNRHIEKLSQEDLDFFEGMLERMTRDSKDER